MRAVGLPFERTALSIRIPLPIALRRNVLVAPKEHRHSCLAQRLVFRSTLGEVSEQLDAFDYNNIIANYRDVRASRWLPARAESRRHRSQCLWLVSARAE